MSASYCRTLYTDLIYESRVRSQIESRYRGWHMNTAAMTMHETDIFFVQKAHRDYTV